MAVKSPRNFGPNRISFCRVNEVIRPVIDETTQRSRSYYDKRWDVFSRVNYVITDLFIEWFVCERANLSNGKFTRWSIS